MASGAPSCVVFLCLAACGSAEVTGGYDLDAGAPDAAERPDGAVSGCGVPTVAAGTSLRRWPYLQSVAATSARVAWTTTSPGTPRVRFARASGGKWTTVTPTSELYDTARTGDTEDYVAHDATLDGLDGDRAYCYEILDGDTPLATGLALHTAFDPAARPLRVLAFGDSGTGGASQRALRDRMLEAQFDLFLHLGDMAYESGTYAQFEQYVFAIYRDFLHSVPTFPAIGNHEYLTDGGGPYLDVYYLFEQALRPADQERYYSFDYGDVHFVALDSNPEMLATVSAASATDMVDWLRDDLAASTARWKIVFCHHPPYSSGAHGSTAGLLSLVVPVLEAGGVDLVLAGHDHDYERTVPIYGDAAAAADKRAIVYVVAGAGGAGLRDAPGDWFTASVNDTVHNFLLLTIDGCNAHGEAIASDGAVVDTFDVNGCE